MFRCPNEQSVLDNLDAYIQRNTNRTPNTPIPII